MRQLSFATLDLALHIDYDPRRDGDVMAYSFNILQSFAPAKLPPEHAMLAAFSHLFASPVGYGAGYYSYKWSEVLDADAFSAFEETGDPFNPELAAKLKKQIYSSGGSADPEALYTAFRGKMPAPDAMMAKRGLA